MEQQLPQLEAYSDDNTQVGAYTCSTGIYLYDEKAGEWKSQF